MSRLGVAHDGDATICHVVHGTDDADGPLALELGDDLAARTQLLDGDGDVESETFRGGSTASGSATPPALSTAG